MSTAHRPWGPPYTDAEVAAETEADGAITVSSDLEELANYLAGAMPAAERAAYQERLETDPALATWAAPLLALDDYRPRAVWDVTKADLRRLDRRITRRLALPRSAPAPKRVNLPRRRRLWRILRTVVVIAATLWLAQGLVALVAEAFVLNALPPDPRALVTLNPRPGSAFVMAPTLDPDSVPRVTVTGPGLIVVHLPELMTRFSEFRRPRLRIETATELVEVAYGVLRIDTLSTGGTTVALFLPGKATIRGRTEPESAARPMATSTEAVRRWFKP